MARTYRIYLIIVLVVLDLILAGILISRPVNKAFLPDNVFISNISEDQATISWVTKRPSESKVLLSTSDKFPILPFFSRVYKDDKDNNNKKGLYGIHHVTVKNLLPSRTYRFGIYLGFKKLRQVKFTTAQQPLEDKSSNIVSGRVVLKDQTGLGGVNVYLRAQTASSSSSLLSTFTDVGGQWNLDLAKLRTSDLTLKFNVDEQVKQQLIIEAGSLGGYELSTKSASLRVWPTITGK